MLSCICVSHRTMLRLLMQYEQSYFQCIKSARCCEIQCCCGPEHTFATAAATGFW